MGELTLYVPQRSYTTYRSLRYKTPLLGISSRVDTRARSYKLTLLEDDLLVEWIFLLDSREAAPRPSTIRDMADILLAKRGESPSPIVGVSWLSTFAKRRDELQSRYSRRYDYQRAQNEDPQSIRAWVESVKRVVEENGILAEDI